MISTSDFNFSLPQELIAQSPLAVRSDSRLLIYDRKAKRVTDGQFEDITELLRPGDVLVRNNTRVLPARLYGKRNDTGGEMEFLLLKRIDAHNFEALVKPGKRAKPGVVYTVSDRLSIRIGGTTDSDGRLVELLYDGILEEVLDNTGHVPLPPYITAPLSDKERYQTVYAQVNGSSAAPTAGLHFTDALLERIARMGVEIADILLHVGLGTFRPVAVEDISTHRMHSEYYEVTQAAADTINRARASGGRIIAVGTTSCRTLESVADNNGHVSVGCGWTDIFITPGYKFRAVDALVTNFHLPKSTLLMLVSALCSREEILEIYAHAIDEKYRFYSFGDAMIIF